MAVNNLVKSLQNIMRSDAGVNGDAQRIEQMVWMFFLKVYDAQELDWECEDEDYQSIIPEQYRWRNWAPSRDENGQKVATALTGDELLRMVNDMFDALKNLPVTEHTKRGQSIVRDVFSEVNQYMKNGVLLRQMIDKVDEIDFTDSQDIHAFGDIYESLLKDLQGAGHAGEFYTPRALTDLIIEMLDPKIGETVGDFAMGTGGFLTSALHHLQPQQKDDDDVERFQHSVIGQEWKPFPYLLAVTNLFLHGIKEPNVLHGDSLARNVRELKESDKVDVIAMNPPYGGATEASVKGNFPQDMRSSETADLFLVLIMYRLRERGRAGVIVPDGFLFGTDGAKLAIKQKMLRDFNLHTIIRLPGSIFSPYTSIATNILFFNNEQAEGAPEGYKTNCTWFYRLDMPEGYKHFSKTRPMLSQHCQPIRDWWHDRHEIVSEDGDEKSRVFTAQQLIDLSCNFDQCKFPKEEEEILPPDELLRQYHERRNSLDAEIDRKLNSIEACLLGKSKIEHPTLSKNNPWKELAEMTMALPNKLRQSILQEAIQGHLVPQDPNEEPASVLLERIRAEKARLVKEGKLKKKDLEEKPISPDEIPFDIPEGWVWCRLGDIGDWGAGATPFKGNPNYYNGDVLWLRTGELNNDVVYDTEIKITETALKECSLRINKIGDVLIAMYGATIGKVAIVGAEMTTNQACCACSPICIFNWYLFYFLMASKSEFIKKGEGGAQPNISRDKLINHLFPLPPLSEQQRIVTKLEELLQEIDKLKA